MLKTWTWLQNPTHKSSITSLKENGAVLSLDQLNKLRSRDLEVTDVVIAIVYFV